MVRSLLDTAGFFATEAESVDAVAGLPSLQDWVDAEVQGWVGGDFGEEDYAAFLREAHPVLAPYENAAGSAAFALPAIIGTGTRA